MIKPEEYNCSVPIRCLPEDQGCTEEALEYMMNCDRDEVPEESTLQPVSYPLVHIPVDTSGDPLAVAGGVVCVSGMLCIIIVIILVIINK